MKPGRLALLLLAALPTRAFADPPDPGKHPRPPGYEVPTQISGVWSRDHSAPDLGGAELPKGVTLWRAEGANDAGLTWGPLEKGRATLADGPLGTLSFDAAHADGILAGGLVATPESPIPVLSVWGQEYLTLIGLTAQSKTFGLGDPDGLTNADVYAEGRALIGAYGQTFDRFSVGPGGVDARLGVDAMIGAVAHGEIDGQIQICGVGVNSSTTGDAYFGAGVVANASFVVDWTKMTVTVGAELGGALGPGGAAGETVEISLAKLLEDPGAAGGCVMDGLHDLASKARDLGTTLVGAAQQAGNALQDAGNAIAALFGPHGPSSGSNVPRDSNTRIIVPRGSPPSTGSSPTLGQRR